MESTCQSLRMECRGAVLRAVLDRPGRQNAINDVLLADLHTVLDRAEHDPQVRAVVLSATGPVFCSGMDVADATRTGQTRDEIADRGGALFFKLLERITTTPRVVVSLVDGRVTGGGVGLVAASDIVYATERSSFGLPEALWGLLPCCVLPFLIRRVGFQPAYAMALSTMPVSGRRAERVCLVDEVAADPEVPLRLLTTRLTRLPPGIVGDAKRYAGRLVAPLDELGSAAVAEFSRLMSAPAVQRRFANFASRHQMPWESEEL